MAATFLALALAVGLVEVDGDAECPTPAAFAEGLRALVPSEVATPASDGATVRGEGGRRQVGLGGAGARGGGGGWGWWEWRSGRRGSGRGRCRGGGRSRRWGRAIASGAGGGAPMCTQRCWRGCWCSRAAAATRRRARSWTSIRGW